MSDMSTPTAKLYVGYVWIEDAPGARLEIWAVSSSEAMAAAKAEYGEDSVVSLWNEEDASAPR